MTGGTARTKINAHKSTQMPIVWENVKTKEPVEKDRELNTKMAHPVYRILVNTCTQFKGRSKKFLKYMSSNKL